VQSLNNEELKLAIDEGQQIIAGCQINVCKNLLNLAGMSGTISFINEKRQVVVRVNKKDGKLAHQIVSSLILPDVTTIVVEEQDAPIC